jgi:hypothetical protein
LSRPHSKSQRSCSACAGRLAFEQGERLAPPARRRVVSIVRQTWKSITTTPALNVIHARPRMIHI